jgi:hypothetical protein
MTLQQGILADLALLIDEARSLRARLGLVGAAPSAPAGLAQIAAAVLQARALVASAGQALVGEAHPQG